MRENNEREQRQESNARATKHSDVYHVEWFCVEHRGEIHEDVKKVLLTSLNCPQGEEGGDEGAVQHGNQARMEFWS